ncbi:lipocalin family protein [Myroides sp. 1354]|uniref:lipocalin family protein n=1 Tax=unclassified Myroides TaxID=2642485 RepID=UPI002578350E|nr:MULTISPECIES: lipocalin family protein [unclassified Myroides]MDM1046263.1 lipocalin family protein [Myroides sp. R163-1]MDM1057199.1 lipocalin family protein [Myroides sp. 1354]MDM1070394.1 lipocalin family protein [Myroides sp. 1372]
MKKIFPLLLLVTFALGLHSCKEQKETKIDKLSEVVGRWELTSAKLYDREAKFLTETTPKDEFGCGNLTWIFTTDQIEILTYIGKDENGNCLEEIIRLKYTIQDHTIHTIDDMGVKEEMLITHLTEDEFTFMTSLPNPLNEKNNAIKYTEISCKRIK